MHNRNTAPLPAPGISRGISIYLDLIRFCAACAVFFSHACKSGISGAVLPNLVQYGIDAVTVFFVLSGFVVSHAATTKDHSFSEYLISRLTRLWSVGIPALLVAALLSHFGTTTAPELYRQQISSDLYADNVMLSELIQNYPLLRLIFGLTFLNEIWTLCIIQYQNLPYWSLSYEFCFYLLFGCYFYLQTWIRPVAILLTCLIFGPKILLLGPVWMAGVVLYHWNPRLSKSVSTLCIIGPIVIYLASHHFEIPQRAWWFDQFLPFEPGWSSHFMWQYLLGMLTSIHLLGVRSIGRMMWIERLEIPARWLAGQTLSIYLFHYSLLFFLAASLPRDWQTEERAIAIMVVCIPIMFALSRLTESKSSSWNIWLRATLSRFIITSSN